MDFRKAKIVNIKKKTFDVRIGIFSGSWLTFSSCMQLSLFFLVANNAENHFCFMSLNVSMTITVKLQQLIEECVINFRLAVARLCRFNSTKKIGGDPVEG